MKAECHCTTILMFIARLTIRNSQEESAGMIDGTLYGLYAYEVNSIQI